MKGFSVIELVIALAVFSSTIVAVAVITLGSPSLLENAQLEERAFSSAESLLYTERARSQDHFDSIIPIASSTRGGVTISLNVLTSPDELLKQLTATATWRDSRSLLRTLSLTTFITDPEGALDTACSSVFLGNWMNAHVSYYTLDTNDLLPPNFSVATTGVDALATTDTLLISGTRSLARENDPTLFLFTVADAHHAPVLRSALSTSSTTAGIAALYATQTTIYVANASACTVGFWCGQLLIIDIRDSAQPTLMAKLLISRALPVAAKSITYRHGYVYLGLVKSPDSSTEPEFEVIDVHDPTKPLLLGGYAIGRTVNAITVRGTYAYVATDDRGHADVLVLDIRDPRHIQEANRITLPPATNSAAGFAHSVAPSDTTVLVGRTAITNAAEFSGFTADTSKLLFSRELGTSLESMLIRGSFAFLATKRDLQIWSIANRTNPVLLTTPIPLAQTGSNSGTAFACSGETLYAGSNSAHGVGSIAVITARP